MELILAMDIIDGKCVRLSKGDFSKKIFYNTDPVSVARSFADAGLRRLHIVDLDGVAGNPLRNIHVVETIASGTTLTIDYGGGIRTSNDVKSVFNVGVKMINTGSIIIKNRSLFKEWLDEFGAERFLPGADVLNKKIKINGWKEDTDLDVFDFIKILLDLQLKTIFCTDISKDGMMKGPSTDLYKGILEVFPALHLIASGGVSCYEDLYALRDTGCSGAIIGKAFYEEKISLTQMGNFINE